MLKPFIRLWALCILGGFPIVANAQLSPEDSLFKKINSARHDTDRSNAYLSLSIFYWNKDADSSLLMAQKAFEIATAAHFAKGIATSCMMLGVDYESRGDYTKALDYHLQALRIAESKGLQGLIRKTLNNIGMVYTDIRDYPKSLDYFHRALELGLRNPDDTAHLHIGTFLVNMAETYARKKQFDSAIAYNKWGMEVAEKGHDSGSLSSALVHIGENYMKKKQYAKALSYLKEGLKIADSTRDEEQIAWSDLTLAEAYHSLQQYDQSIHYAGLGIQRAEKMHMNESIRNGSNILYLNYRDQGNYKQALYYRNREIDMTDSLDNLEKQKKIRNLQSDYELEKKEHQIDLLNKDGIIRENAITRERSLRYFFIALVILMGLGCLLLLRSNARNRRLNRLLKSRNEEISRQNQQLEDLNRVKNKLLSIIGHDLRSPVNMLKGFVYLLQKSALSEEQIRHFITKMDESLMTTGHLLDNLLFWAKSQMEGMHVSPRSFDLREVIHQNKKLLQGRAEQKKITLVVDEVGAPVPVYADETMIDIVIRNLLENAVKFSREGGRVLLTTSATTHFIQVSIRDDGQGIPFGDQAKIFDKSVSFTTSGTSREKGSGLGVSLSKELVEKNGGKISFKSEPGKGTCFFVTIPNAPVI